MDKGTEAASKNYLLLVIYSIYISLQLVSSTVLVQSNGKVDNEYLQNAGQFRYCYFTVWSFVSIRYISNIAKATILIRHLFIYEYSKRIAFAKVHREYLFKYTG